MGKGDEKKLLHGYYPKRFWFWPSSGLAQAGIVIIIILHILWLTTPWNRAVNKIHPFIGPFPFSIVWHYTLIILVVITLSIVGYKTWNVEEA